MSAKLKQKSVHALLLAFVLASILFLLPDATVDHDSGFMSSELEVKETVEENVTNTSYVNSDGAITDAIDMGYATVQRTRNAKWTGYRRVLPRRCWNPSGPVWRLLWHLV